MLYVKLGGEKMIEKYKNIILKFLHKYKYVCMLLFLIFIILIIILSILCKNKNTKVIKINDSVESELIKTEEIVVEHENNKEGKYVDIKGMVAAPGVYEINDNERVSDLIKKAGGLIEGANTNCINLSKKLEDEMVIIIYSNQEILNYKQNKDSNYEDIIVECICPDKSNDACIDDDKIENGIVAENNKNDNVSEEIKNDTIKDDKTTKVSINKASLLELMEIPGIGEAKAKSIIAYRTDEKTFTTIDDIKNVSGIGDSLFEKIKDYITV